MVKSQSHQLFAKKQKNKKVLPSNIVLIMQPKKIVIIGPESTGKSAISRFLAAHYQTLYVPEYARTYLQNKDGNYQIKDLNIIAQEQHHQINLLATKANRILFCDTDAYVIKIWSEVKYNSCSKEILDLIVETEIDFYLLMDIDLPWEYDALREAPELLERKKLMLMYTDAMANSGVPFTIIGGQDAQRQTNAIAAVDTFLNQ
jgi:NadR type nicotinamide-nucleotide adenylyltransferase